MHALAVHLPVNPGVTGRCVEHAGDRERYGRAEVTAVRGRGGRARREDAKTSWFAVGNHRRTFQNAREKQKIREDIS